MDISLKSMNWNYSLPWCIGLQLACGGSHFTHQQQEQQSQMAFKLSEFIGSEGHELDARLGELTRNIFAADAAYQVVNAESPEDGRQATVPDPAKFFRVNFKSYAFIERSFEADGSIDRIPGVVAIQDNTVTVALHGTRSGSIMKGDKGWSTNLFRHPIVINHGIKVHAGFYNKSRIIFPFVVYEIRRLLKQELGEDASEAAVDARLKEMKITFTGHSQGGAMAHLLALHAKFSGLFEEPDQLRVHAISPAIAVYGRRSIEKVEELLGSRNLFNQYSARDPVSIDLNRVFATGASLAMRRALSADSTPLHPGIRLVTNSRLDAEAALKLRMAGKQVEFGHLLESVAAFHYANGSPPRFDPHLAAEGLNEVAGQTAGSSGIDPTWSFLAKVGRWVVTKHGTVPRGRFVDPRQKRVF